MFSEVSRFAPFLSNHNLVLTLLPSRQHCRRHFASSCVLSYLLRSMVSPSVIPTILTMYAPRGKFPLEPYSFPAPGTIPNRHWISLHPIGREAEHNARIVWSYACNPNLSSCYILVSYKLLVCDHHFRVPVVARFAIFAHSILAVPQSTHFYFLNCVPAVRTLVIHYSHNPGLLVSVLTVWAGTGPHNAHSQ